MLPKHHIAAGFFFALLVHLWIFPSVTLFGAVIIFLSTVLVDVDHYMIYLYRKKDFSLKGAYHYFIDMSNKLCASKKHRGPLLIFHTVEFLILLIALSFYHWYFSLIIVGIVFHMALDLYFMVQNNLMHARSHSIVHHISTRYNVKHL